MELSDKIESLKRQNYVFLLIIALLGIACSILLFIVIIKINKEGTQCTLNPLVFGAKKLREVNPHELQCQCNLFSDLPSDVLYFNDNSSWIVKAVPKMDPNELPNFTQWQNIFAVSSP